jgi:hypothetical protein
MVSPTWPDPVKIRSAIVTVEMEDGSVMQMFLTPAPSQPVQVNVASEFETVTDGVMRKTVPTGWTVTIDAGNYWGHMQSPGETVVQADPPAVYP